jgi:hypothetical protein
MSHGPLLPRVDRKWVGFLVQEETFYRALGSNRVVIDSYIPGRNNLDSAESRPLFRRSIASIFRSLSNTRVMLFTCLACSARKIEPTRCSGTYVDFQPDCTASRRSCKSSVKIRCQLDSSEVQPPPPSAPARYQRDLEHNSVDLRLCMTHILRLFVLV